jgi:hypothetical protein
VADAGGCRVAGGDLVSSKKNDAINGVVQGSTLYSQLNAYQRRTLVALLRVAYSIGRRHGQEDAS